MRRCLFCVSLWDSYPPGSKRTCLVFLITRFNLFRNSLMITLSHDAQISPDKNVSFPCTNAAFTLPPNLWASFVLCLLAQGLSLICGFCPSSRTFALRLPSDHPSRNRPCLRLVLLLVSITYEHIKVLVQGTSTPKAHAHAGRTRITQADR
jgi:hypothetical protein